MLLGLIIACEVGFWVFLFLGLFARYLLKRPRLSKGLLLCVPLMDLVLLCASILDLSNGATAEFAHGLAAAYLGFTLVFGPSLIQWADEHMAHKFSNAPKPNRPAHGWEYTLYEWKLWLKGVMASVIAAALLFAAIFFIDHPQKTEALSEWFYILSSLLFCWLLLYPLWYTVFPKKQSRSW